MKILSCVPKPAADIERDPSCGAASSARRSVVRSKSAAKCRRLAHSEEGSPLIEFAFVLPLMMVCLTGMFAFGIAIYNAINLTQATGQAAQRLQQVRATTTDPCADALTALQLAAPTLKTSGITISISVNSGTASTGTSCTGAAGTFNGAQGLPFTLATTYPCTLALYGINLGGCNLQAKTTEYAY